MIRVVGSPYPGAGENEPSLFLGNERVICQITAELVTARAVTRKRAQNGRGLTNFIVSIFDEFEWYNKMDGC